MHLTSWVVLPWHLHPFQLPNLIIFTAARETMPRKWIQDRTYLFWRDVQYFLTLAYVHVILTGRCKAQGFFIQMVRAFCVFIPTGFCFSSPQNHVLGYLCMFPWRITCYLLQPYHQTWMARSQTEKKTCYIFPYSSPHFDWTYLCRNRNSVL